MIEAISIIAVKLSHGDDPYYSFYRLPCSLSDLIPMTVLEITEWSADDRRSTRRCPSCRLRCISRPAPNRSATLVIEVHTHSLTMLTAEGSSRINESSASDCADGLLYLIQILYNS